MRDRINYLKWLTDNKEIIRKKKTQWANSTNGKLSAKRWRDKSPKALFKLYKSSARKRNISFEISLEIFTEYINENCSYCGQSAIPKRNGIDRVNNTEGYILDNIVSCCFKCNQMKGKLSVDDFYSQLIKIFEYAIK